MWFELHEDVTAVITREEHLKKQRRAWKLRLIEKANLEWKDL